MIWDRRLEDRVVEVYLQSSFRAYDTAATGQRSLSMQLIRDILQRSRSRVHVRIAIVDAKCRVSRENVLEAMESAHIYHDSLRMGSRPPDMCLIFVPATGGAPWLEEAGFHFEFGVGVQVFSREGPDSMPVSLAAWLEQN